MRKIIDLALRIDYGRYYRFIVMVIIILKMTNKITTEWYWILALIWVPFVFWLSKDKDLGDCREEDND